MATLLTRWQGKAGVEDVQRLLSILQTEQVVSTSSPATLLHRETPMEPLSQRERKVLRVLSRLASGLSNAEIADELVVSINTIRTQMQSIYRKVDGTRRQEAVMVARHWRLL